MISLPCFKRRFTPDWRIALIALIVFCFFLRLGFWQLHRAHEKKEMLHNQSIRSSQTALDWQDGMPNPQQYQRIQLKGQYLPLNLFLDNQHHNHQFGYDVVSPLILASGKIVLIDRGWVAGEALRLSLPKVDTPKTTLELSGYAYFPSEKNWILGQPYEFRGKNSIIIERIDTKLIEQVLHKSVYPFIMRLDKNQNAGFVREWAVVAMPPERHYAYALQWFAMALVILILFIVLNLKKVYETEKI